MTTDHDWQARTGDIWADEWRRTDRSFAHLATRLDAAILAAAPPGRGRVLDIGCGAGATSAALAARRPDLAIAGIDLSPALVAVARARVPAAAIRVADAARDPIGPAPDLLVSRHGVMFFADPLAVFTRLFHAAAPAATLVFSCFARRALNAFAGDLVAEVTGAAPPDDTGYVPGPFGFSDPVFVARLLADAGWIAAPPRAVDFAYVVGAGGDPLADATDFLSRIGPLARAIAAAADPLAMRARLTAALVRYRGVTDVRLPASAWIWRASKGESS